MGALYFVLTNQIMTSIASMRTFLAERAIAEHEVRPHPRLHPRPRRPRAAPALAM